MKMTVYKMSGMAYDYLAAVDEENKRIWVLTDSNEMHPPIAELEREDVTDCSSWDVFDFADLRRKDETDEFDLREWTYRSPQAPEYATFDDMFYDVVLQSGTADIMEKWDDMDI